MFTSMKGIFIFIVPAAFVTIAHADPIPQAIIDAAVSPRQFSIEMLNPDITQENIHNTICRKGFTKTIRPAVVYTNGVKFKLMREAGVPEEDADKYELDHIVPLAVGGHPRKLANLMLQPYEGTLGARQKDRLELKLQNMVCNDELDLATAQREIGGDWVTAYTKYIRHKH
jgi:hypothetical protein